MYLFRQVYKSQSAGYRQMLEFRFLNLRCYFIVLLYSNRMGGLLGRTLRLRCQNIGLPTWWRRDSGRGKRLDSGPGHKNPYGPSAVVCPFSRARQEGYNLPLPEKPESTPDASATPPIHYRRAPSPIQAAPHKNPLTHPHPSIVSKSRNFTNHYDHPFSANNSILPLLFSHVAAGGHSPAPPHGRTPQP